MEGLGWKGEMSSRINTPVHTYSYHDETSECHRKTEDPKSFHGKIKHIIHKATRIKEPVEHTS